jgi:DNA-binding CsgD family transcriptional regulator
MATHTRLRGRRRERRTLDALLDAVRAGESRALVVRGEAGVGKTALLDYALARASGFRVARAAGVQSEMELPFAGLHQLCVPMLGRLERLPDPQRDALRTAFGLSAGDPPDRFLVGLAVLSLLSDVAEEMPLICVVDDAQWLDRTSAEALAFVARRLLAESVAFVFAVREPGEERDLIGLPELAVEGLGDDDARELLASVMSVPLDERVRDRIVAETRGNPLALLELPRGLTPAELAGGFGLPGAPALSGQIEDSFRRRLAHLPPETRQLLLVAAAEPVGDPALVRRAAERLGAGVGAAVPAAEAGLLEVGAHVRFRHPLVRSAIYRTASPQERRSAHGALAEVADPGVDPDRRAWHRAHATPGPDEDVAAELERSADRAQARGGLAAAAAFLARAAELTPDPALRAERALAAAQASHQSGSLDAALGLVVTAQSGPLNELQRAQVDVLRAQISFASSRDSDAPALLRNAAKRLELLDVRLAREIYLDALSAALFAGRLASGGGLLEVAAAARAAHPSLPPPRPPDLLLDGLATLITDSHAAGTPILRRAVSAFRSEEISAAEGLRWLWVASHAAGLLWDYERLDMLSARKVQLTRDSGALSVLPIALNTRTLVHLFAGDLTIAASLVERVDAVTDVTRSRMAAYGAVALAAFRGRAAEASELIESTLSQVVRRGEGGALTFIQWATAVLHNGLGRYEDALQAAEQAAEDPDGMWFSMWALAELIEAATRSGKAERAAGPLERLSGTTRAAGTGWALGIEARSRALLSDGEVADSLYRQAIDALEGAGLHVELARARLLYGEWLRRERRRLDAREQLRSARERFIEFGVEAFAERARVELEATGEHARKRTVETSSQLTAQEAQIARLARDGLSNPEIGSQLFISPRTVEYHLHKVFAKLGISTRGHLDRALPRERGAASRPSHIAPGAS